MKITFPESSPQTVYADQSSQTGEASARSSQTQKTSRTPLRIKPDKITVSPQAKQKQKEQVHTAEQYWDKFIKERAKDLEPGHTQTYVRKGNNITIKEYDGDRLVKEIKGKYSVDSISLDTKQFNRSGEVSQTIHTDLTGLESDKVRLSRQIKWYDGKMLTKELQDSMLVKNNKKDREELSTNLEAFQNKILGNPKKKTSISMEELQKNITKDFFGLKYTASIQEYTAGQLSRNITIGQEANYANLTNRNAVDFEGMDKFTTKEFSHSINLAVSIEDYDTDGNILRQVNFTDSQSDGAGPKDGRTQQDLNISWYNEGKLVSRQSGHVSTSEGKNIHLGSRAKIFEMLGMSQEEYSSPENRSASALLKANMAEASEDAGHFGGFIDTHALARGFKYASDIAEKDTGDLTYSMEWTEETYRDGKMVARKHDEESAEKYTPMKSSTFRTGGALTENDMPATLRKTLHIEESYEDGRLKERGELRAEEYIDPDTNGPDKLKTYMQGHKTHGSNTGTITKELLGNISEVDNEYHAAPLGISRRLNDIVADIQLSVPDKKPDI